MHHVVYPKTLVGIYGGLWIGGKIGEKVLLCGSSLGAKFFDNDATAVRDIGLLRIEGICQCCEIDAVVKLGKNLQMDCSFRGVLDE